MKPFNLEEAKAGKPVCTGDGKEVLLVFFDLKGFDKPLGGVLFTSTDEHTLLRWGPTGQYFINGEPSSFDLFMKTTKQQRWINVFEDMPNETFTVYTTKEAALRGRSHFFKYLCDPIQIEWEE